MEQISQITGCTSGELALLTRLETNSALEMGNAKPESIRAMAECLLENQNGAQAVENQFFTGQSIDERKQSMLLDRMNLMLKKLRFDGGEDSGWLTKLRGKGVPNPVRMNIFNDFLSLS